MSCSQFSVLNLSPCQPGTKNYTLQRIYSVAKTNPEKCLEENAAGYNLYHLAAYNKDSHTALLLLRLLHSLSDTAYHNVQTRNGKSLLQIAAER